jgi:hypothetical protein
MESYQIVIAISLLVSSCATLSVRKVDNSFAGLNAAFERTAEVGRFIGIKVAAQRSATAASCVGCGDGMFKEELSVCG